MAKLIKVNGEVYIVEPKNGNDFKWAELTEFVEGSMQIVRMPDDQIMVVNEEGRRTKAPNAMATAIYNNVHRYHVTIHGNVLICKKSEVI